MYANQHPKFLSKSDGFIIQIGLQIHAETDSQDSVKYHNVLYCKPWVDTFIVYATPPDKQQRL